MSSGFLKGDSKWLSLVEKKLYKPWSEMLPGCCRRARLGRFSWVFVSFLWRGTSMPRRCWGQSWAEEVCQLRREHVGVGSKDPLSLGDACCWGGGEKLPCHPSQVGNIPQISRDQSSATPALHLTFVFTDHYLILFFTKNRTTKSSFCCRKKPHTALISSRLCWWYCPSCS